MSEEKKRVPKLRFPEFEDEWEQRKLQDYCEMYNGDRSAKYPNASDMVEEGVPFINAGDLENGIVNLKSCNKISREKYNDLGGAKLQMGDIVYCLRGTLGKNAIIENFDEGTVASSLVAIRPQNIDGKYLYYILNSDIEYRQRVVHDEGAAQPNLSAKSVSEFVMPVPSIEEQKKISDYLTNLDHYITLHQRKLQRLKQVEKGLLQKMFPKEGGKIPEIRFSEFTEDWEQRKLSDFTWASGKRNKEDLDLNPYAITNEHGFIPQNEAHEDFGYMKDTDRKVYNIVTPNSFAYNPARINIGSIGYYEGIENVIVSSLYEVFQTANDVDDRFLWYWFKSNEFTKWVERLQEGSVRLYFYYDKLCECQMFMPSITEQKKIATLLGNLDHLIILHQRKLEHLQQLKKGLLQQMFI